MLNILSLVLCIGTKLATLYISLTLLFQFNLTSITSRPTSVSLITFVILMSVGIGGFGLVRWSDFLILVLLYILMSFCLSDIPFSALAGSLLIYFETWRLVFKTAASCFVDGVCSCRCFSLCSVPYHM